MIDKAISPASIQSMLQTLRSHQTEAAGKTAGMPGATELNGSAGAVQKQVFLIWSRVRSVRSITCKSNPPKCVPPLTVAKTSR